MPRGKRAQRVEEQTAPVADAPAIAFAPPPTDPLEVRPLSDAPSADQPKEPAAPDQPKQWGKPYKAVLTCPQQHFELGENFQFRQVVFTFDGNPGPAITQKLKDAGFKYRANEKSWTITANAANREMAYQLAQELRGQTQAMSR